MKIHGKKIMSGNAQYRDLAKSNLVFGGVKVLQVLVSILKTKIVAILLGPSGIGVQSLLVSAITTMHQFTNLGISQSSVRAISIEPDSEKKKSVIKTLNILATLLGLGASIICLLFAAELSRLVYGTEEYKAMFMIVAASLFFESISNAQIAILQGLRLIVVLSKASLVGAFISLLISVPLYYFWRIESIPYVILSGYIVLAGVNYLYRRLRFNASIVLANDELKCNSKSILGLGMTLMASNGIMSIFALGLNTFIYRLGGNIDVGYYQAASVCTYSAINILIAILASDYFPRLSGNINDAKKSTALINAQIELLLLVLAPIVCFMVIFPSFFVRLLYSSEFLGINHAVQIMALSLLFRVVWHCFSYVILAKGDKKMYFLVDAILCNGLFFIGNMLGFYYLNLTGIATSYFVISGIVMLMLYFVVRNKYLIKISSSTLILGALILTGCMSVYLVNYFTTNMLKLMLNIIFLITMLFFVSWEIERKMKLFTIIITRIRQCRNN